MSFDAQTFALPTGVGEVLVEWGPRGIRRVRLGTAIRDRRARGRNSGGSRAVRTDAAGLVRRLAAEFRRYASGQPVQWRAALDLTAGTPFQRQVWRVLQAIPYGQTRSYGWVARQVGRPRAARAVGAACGANPIPILVPCHRVVASDGSLGGFSAGLAWKRRLLALEQGRAK